MDRMIAYCGVDCSACTDFLSGKCPSCRLSEWKDDDICMPVRCCREKGIACCGECPVFPCAEMADFYEESDSHREAYARMAAVQKRSETNAYIDPQGGGKMEFKDVVRDRYSCKKYSDRQVEGGKLTAILEAGRLAPTARNLQEQHVYVLQSAEALAKIDGATHCRYGAPVVLVVAYDKENVFTYPGGKRNSGIEDATIVATHMILAAADEGVDSCWVNNFDPDKLAEALGLPGNEEILMLMDLGYAAEDAGPLPNHSSRKDLSETVTYM